MWDVKYRPMRFTDVLGQPGTVQLLRKRLRNGTALDTSYIFAGGHGQGKTTLARILARAALCTRLDAENPDPCNECDNCRDILADQSAAFVEKDAASNGSVAHVREMCAEIPYAIFGASKRIWLFDEAHRMSKEAQDVLLKPIEEKRVLLIFCTTEPEAVRGTIRSRCEEYIVRKVTREDVLTRMKSILVAEGVEHQDDAVLTVIDHSGGHVRDVLNKLEMISQSGAITVDSVREYLHLSVVVIYFQILLSLGDPRQALSLVEQACERVPPDEVAAGIAEAAMNSFRLTNGYHTEFTYVDRDMAKKVGETFGASTIKLAEYFLRSRMVTRVSLMNDVLSLSQSNGAVPAPMVLHSAPPIVVAAPAQVALPAPVSAPASPAVEQPSATPVVTAPPPAPVVLAPPAPLKPMDPELRSDGVGPRGSSDIQALTKHDHKVVPRDAPRGTVNGHLNLAFNVSEREPTREMTPDEWGREFLRTWDFLRSRNIA